MSDWRNESKTGMTNKEKFLQISGSVLFRSPWSKRAKSWGIRFQYCQYVLNNMIRRRLNLKSCNCFDSKFKRWRQSISWKRQSFYSLSITLRNINKNLDYAFNFTELRTFTWSNEYLPSFTSSRLRISSMPKNTFLYLLILHIILNWCFS